MLMYLVSLLMLCVSLSVVYVGFTFELSLVGYAFLAIVFAISVVVPWVLLAKSDSHPEAFDMMPPNLWD